METALVLTDSCGLEQTSGAESTTWLAYFEDEAQGAGFCDGLARLAAERALPLEIGSPQTIRRENWHDGWREYFRPVMVSPRLRIAPPWERQPTPTSNIIELLIEPGMAFGTGTHETTQLCLRLLERLMPRGARVLDVGTGSGILGIAAFKLGAAKVVGFDLDPDTAGNLRKNLALNGIAPNSFLFALGPLEAIASRPPFDLIICNMLSHEFLPLLRRFPPYVTQGGLLILSGFLGMETETVEQAAARAGFGVTVRETAGDWHALAGRLD